MKSIHYRHAIAITALQVAAEEAYQRDLVDTGMVDSYIGPRCEFASKDDWLSCKMDEWIAEAERLATEHE